jgi:SAM-dependent methyltransferase
LAEFVEGIYWMCNRSGIGFAQEHLSEACVCGKRVLEVGSRDVNGSIRPILESRGPTEYIGVDIVPGPGVDELCDAGALADRFGEKSFDVVVSTELIEHVRDWRAAIDNMKRVLKPGGQLLVTTRSRGFAVHAFPWDYWRYEPSDMAEIFADFEGLEIVSDPLSPGVFVKGRKPEGIHRRELDGIELYSVITGSRTASVSKFQEARFKVRHRIHTAYRRVVPERARARIKQVLRPVGR